MYTTFFGLAEPPFNITPDPRFVFPSQRYREALSALVYGIRERKGFILLTGEVGSGKTTICRKLVHDLQQEDVKLALILNPGLSELELLKAINDEFGIPSYHNAKKGLLDELNDFLLTENRKGTNVVIIIDESQTLEPSVLEQIRLLSNLETENDKLVQIILIGQPELNDTLSLPQLEQLNQRIGVRYHIQPLTYEESIDYIKYRLQVARAKVDINFTEDALKRMYASTHGIPRKINVVCDRALLGCYAVGSYSVDGSIMNRAISEVGVDKSSGSRRHGARLNLPDLSPVKQQMRRVFSGYSLSLIIILLIGLGVVAFAVGTAIYMASVKEKHDSGLIEERIAAQKPLALDPLQALIDADSKDTSETVPVEGSSKPKVVIPVTPTPTTEEYRTRLAAAPNWVYEHRNISLVRVNNKEAALTACKLSMLKMWGYHVNMDVVSKMDNPTTMDDSNETFRYITVPGNLRKILKYNLPVIVHLKLDEKDKASLRSEYVVLLKADGNQIIIGDPLWGVSTTTVEALDKKWLGATAMFVDVEQLGSIARGDRNERIRSLQQLLRDYGMPASQITGVYDVDTCTGLKSLQNFYGLPDTGSLDPLTLMIVNSRIMREGPKLNNAVGW
ncbi:MAG: AAA family ATPase [Candidatus Sumerlaeales bacterium]|nr:AAA family ATPase [Candidatus Sumerlaeales bacterium]